MHEEKLVIPDEIQRMPGLFRKLRGRIDRGRRQGRPSGRFLLLGSASIHLLKQSGETLAGRIAHVELGPLHTLEVDETGPNSLWARGGDPDSFPSGSGTKRHPAQQVHSDLSGARVPQLGPRLSAATLRRFWTMLAHRQGGLPSTAELARSLAVDGRTVSRYLDLLVDLLLVCRLSPCHANVGKRLVKSPRIYVRDSGIVHMLPGLTNLDAVPGLPVAGGSRESFVLENLPGCAPELARASFYRTAAGAVLEMPGGALWAIEIKRGLAPRLEKGFHHARADLAPLRSFLVYSRRERYPRTDGAQLIGLREMAQELTQAR